MTATATTGIDSGGSDGKDAAAPWWMYEIIMEMNDTVTNAPMLENPQQWRLMLRVAPGGFDALLYNPESGEPMQGIRESRAEQPDMLPALEAFVYDNPLLLSDFGSVTVVIETSRYVLLPPGVSDERLIAEIFRNSLPEAESPVDQELITDNIPAASLGIAFQPGDKLLTFLRRTFHNPRIVHHLNPLLSYFATRRREGNHARTFVQVCPDRLDVVIFRDAGVALCNSFSYSTADDAAYYILATRQLTGDLDPDNDEIYLCGDRERRQEIAARLGEFVKNILPVLFPPALFRQGRGVMDMPFDLILMPLCE